MSLFRSAATQFPVSCSLMSCVRQYARNTPRTETNKTTTRTTRTKLMRMNMEFLQCFLTNKYPIQRKRMSSSSLPSPALPLRQTTKHGTESPALALLPITVIWSIPFQPYIVSNATNAYVPFHCNFNYDIKASCNVGVFERARECALFCYHV